MIRRGILLAACLCAAQVSKPPHREGGKMKMTVDGVELTKTE